jgi:hypothetical protein
LERAACCVDSGYAAFDELRAELMLQLVPHEARADFTRRAYGREEGHYQRLDSLFDWEVAAVQRFFPKPPARVLVGGAGAGREMAGLARLGYAVIGLEPVAELARHCRAMVQDGLFLGCVVADYEALVSGVPEIAVAAPFDAVVLGWTSVSYVCDRGVVARLLPVVRSLAPRAPVLVSWIEHGALGLSSLRWRRYLEKITGRVVHPSERFLAGAGFVCALDHTEIRALAAAAGYRVHLGSFGSSHAVLLPEAM